MKHQEKLENYLESYTRTKYFQDRVAKTREIIGIPKKGIPFPKPAPTTYIITRFPATIFGISYQGNFYPTFMKKWSTTDKSCNEILQVIPYTYMSYTVVLFFNIYILYNERRYDVFNQDMYEGTISLINYRRDFLETEGVDDNIPYGKDYTDYLSQRYPLLVGISPYATQNEVIDFIKTEWKGIQEKIANFAKNNDIPPYKKERKYLASIRKRSSKSKRIEDLIYENKDLNLEQLRKLVKEKTGTILDQGEVGKIRSLAIKRREKSGK